MKLHKNMYIPSFYLLAIFSIYSTTSFAQVGVSPRLLELSHDAIDKTHAFRLFNFSKSDIEVNLEIANWTMDEMNELQVIASDNLSLDQWTVVNPLHFKVNAGSSQTIRLAFRAPADIPAGEYRTILYFNQVITDNFPDKKQLRSKFRIGAAIYLQVGEKLPAAKINSVKLDNHNITLDVTNSGNTHVRFNGYWALWNQQPNDTAFSLMIKQKNETQSTQSINGLVSYGKMPTTPLLPKHSRLYKIKKPQTITAINQRLTFQFVGEFVNQHQLLTIPIDTQNQSHTTNIAQ
ncbi:hypothetical protein MNBD_GAMMA02-1232 [hydrothermal vent metagenome]|uniref:Pili assembly chaperone N-terminal domain-containing protein n=1 Tax=hydrothermal vent metagenome TaxID=652676 RepID=A0A3B0VW64_9ZZZZ